MLNRISSALTGLLLLACGSINASAQQFRADLVHLKPEGASPAKVIVSGDKIRFETMAPQKRSIMVMDMKQKTGFMALPESKMYSLLMPRQISTPMPLFHPEDPENACKSWETSLNKPGTCTKVGDETVNGRAAVRYKGTAMNGDTGSAWVDRKLKFVIKWEGKAGASEFRNIQEGPQSAALFEVPKDYERMDSPAGRQEGAKKKAAPGRPASPRPQN